MKKIILLTCYFIIASMAQHCLAQEVKPSTLGLGDPILCSTYYYKVPSFSFPTGKTYQAQILGYRFSTPLGGSQYNNTSTFYTSNEIGILWNLPNLQAAGAFNQGKDRLLVKVECEVKFRYIDTIGGANTVKDAFVTASPYNETIKGVGPIGLLHVDYELVSVNKVVPKCCGYSYCCIK